MSKFFTILLSIFFLLPVRAAFLPIGPGPVSKKEVIAAENHFPEVLGTNLEGKETLLPDELAGERNLLVVAFARKQQDDINTWIDATKSFYDKYEGFEFYEIPVIKVMNFFMRFNINNGMRYGIDDKNQRLRTVTLYLDKKSFKRSLRIENEDQIHVLLLDNDGRILWRTTGRVDSEKLNTLETQLNENK